MCVRVNMNCEFVYTTRENLHRGRIVELVQKVRRLCNELLLLFRLLSINTVNNYNNLILH